MDISSSLNVPSQERVGNHDILKGDQLMAASRNDVNHHGLVGSIITQPVRGRIEPHTYHSLVLVTTQNHLDYTSSVVFVFKGCMWFFCNIVRVYHTPPLTIVGVYDKLKPLYNQTERK